MISCFFSLVRASTGFSFGSGSYPLKISFFDYLFEVASSHRVGIRVASPRQSSFTLFQDGLQQGHLTPFLYCHKFPSFKLLDRSLVNVPIAKTTDVKYNNFYLVIKVTIIWQIGPLEFQGCFPRCVQVVPRPEGCSPEILGYNLRKDVPYHQLAQHLPPSTYTLLRVLSVAPCSLFPRMSAYCRFSG